MKKLFTISLIVPLFLISCGKSEEVRTVVNPPVLEEQTVETGTSIETQKDAIESNFGKAATLSSGDVSGSWTGTNSWTLANSWSKSNLVTVDIGEISFQVPWDYSVDKSRTDALVSIWGMKENGMNLFGLTVYEEKTPFMAFEDYFQDLKTNFIKKLVKENNKNLTDPAIDVELQKFTGRYSFESKETNGIKAVIHKRDFYGTIGKVYDMYVFLGNGKILHFVSETDYSQIVEQIYSSIK